ncbi:ATP-binding protein [Candidatus Methylocalor cossyra]|uniref:histidine kinase n=1 Tax=Candidatus Methylocalor cossyra TaxID=3108543 RepID=A0ABM9NGE6_9GAMM
MSDQVAEHLLAPIAIGLPLLGLALALAIGQGLKPLLEVSRQVARCDAQRLAPLPSRDVPAEIKPLIDQLNGLFGRIAESLANERRFTADAAHELRTPIAAIRAQAQVAQQARDPDTRNHALDGLVRGCERAAQLIDQLLTLARLDARAGPPQGHCDLLPVVRTVLAELAPWAHGRGIALELLGDESVPVPADETLLLQVLVRNLVDNAVRYSPAGQTVTVRVAAEPRAVRLEVLDRGPGIPAAERDRVLGRFYRLAGYEEGAGLGLSIALRIAELCGARLELLDHPEGPGLCATVRFPKA